MASESDALIASSDSYYDTSYSSTIAWTYKKASTNMNACSVPAEATERLNNVSRRGLHYFVTLAGGSWTFALARKGRRERGAAHAA